MDAPVGDEPQRPVGISVGRRGRLRQLSLCQTPGAPLRPSGLTAALSGQIVHHMVNYRNGELDRVFAALGDPTRRAILARLEQAESLTVSAIAEPFAIKLPAVMKHLDVLGDAGLVTRSKQGRTVDVRLSPGPLREARDWLARYERFWSPALDRLAAYAEAKEAEAQDTERGAGE
jgi:DNA-binding transcriptional ArsR family regulator